ncbi:hypothetical protein GCM10011613_18990 [Cellvibrio zantedeschiae]|uniref:Uncharacterized protein n=1 Tax=Cellvibrio zantedeschiae TaxID=1237077 RepID=A0ABQ3B0X1_9GAMM|nr:DUF5985 family protein [Cellvibrio zantedeschiae]GGY73895.1 hypothetical protein GCM10011613_18990 [Cellvibrio zantedeschiae]
MSELLLGAIATCCFIAGLFFLRFWKTTHDRFFLFFALSFLIEAVNRVSLVIFFDLREGSPVYYLVRFVAYSFIVIAILDKNRQNKQKNNE